MNLGLIYDVEYDTTIYPRKIELEALLPADLTLDEDKEGLLVDMLAGAVENTLREILSLTG
jgi:hypothetical protein|tara:strand:- start:637 stop:819 length:183 start_codon:yes stop_codon:yes gene_type:complete